MSNLKSQGDPPTFKNLRFSKKDKQFSNNQGFGFKNAFDGVLGLPKAHVECYWCFLGNYFRVFAGFRWHLEFS